MPMDANFRFMHQGRFMSMIPTLVSSSNPADVFTHASKWDLRNVVTYGQGCVNFMLQTSKVNQHQHGAWNFTVLPVQETLTIHSPHENAKMFLPKAPGAC